MQWYTIESEHFVVSYHAPLEEVARRVALVAEYSHEVLVPALGHAPEEKTLIVVDDTTDSTNGFASVLPRNRIRILATAPPSKSNLSDHDDWLYGLIAHEYTHILHLDTISGIPYLVNKVIGKTWAPNQVQPRWIIEGLATYEESKYSSGGRLRNALATMVLRMATLTGDERDLDEMTNGPRKWPQGNVAYLYGSHFLKYVFDRLGEDKVAKMSKNFGATIVPYGINRSIYRATGHGFVDLHADWKSHRQEQFSLEQEAIERAGRREGRRLTFSGLSNTSPKYSKNGKDIVWFHSPGTQRGAFYKMPAGGDFGKASHYATIDRAGSFDLMRDGSMVLEISDTYRAEYSSQELFRYFPKTGRSLQLTKRARIRDPKVSPDERQVAFAVTGQSRRRLAVMKLQPEANIRILWEGENPYDQALDPTWSPDGTKVAFTAWRQGGFKDILIVDVESGEVEELSKNRAQDLDPVFSPDGKYLYYSSDRTGVFNVYAYDLKSKELFAVTNVLGCALSASISPDGSHMLYQGYVSDGSEIYEMLLEPASWRKAALYVNDRPAPVAIADDAYAISKPRAYSPLETLAPNRYDLAYDAVAGRLSLVLNGEDLIGRHNYTLATSVAVATGQANISGSYSYGRNWASLQFAGSRSVVRRGGLVIDDRNTAFLEERLGATLRLGLPVLRKPTGAGTISIAYDVDSLQAIDEIAPQPDPNNTIPREPETNTIIAGLALRFSYSDTRGAVYTLGPQLGKSISLSMRLDHPALGSDFTSLTMNYRLNTYYKLPWGQTPILSFRFAGGIRTSNRARASRFSLGGVSQQDLVQALLGVVRVGNTGFLRGYEPRAVVGTQMHLANIEYRQELWDIETGVQTLPFYLQKLHIAGLFDLGNAFDDEFDLLKFKTSLGVSLRLNLLIGYFIPGSLDIGYARGLNEGAVDEWWTLLTGSI